MTPPSFLDPLLAAGAPPMVLGIAGADSAPLATTIEAAFDSKSRTRGLLGRTALAPRTAIILAPCQAIHTFKMQFAIDVIFAGRDGRVLKVRHNLGPSRLAMAARAFAVVEMAGGEAAARGLKAGDMLVVRPSRL